MSDEPHADLPHPDARHPRIPPRDAPPPAAPLPERVLHALRVHVTPALPAELAGVLGIPEPALRRLLGDLVRRRLARRAGGGRYTTSRHQR